jgi:hypothetical protein
MFVDDEMLKQTRTAVRLLDWLVGDLNLFTILAYHSWGGACLDTWELKKKKKKKKKRCNRGRDKVGNLSIYLPCQP